LTATASTPLAGTDTEKRTSVRVESRKHGIERRASLPARGEGDESAARRHEMDDGPRRTTEPSLRARAPSCRRAPTREKPVE